MKDYYTVLGVERDASPTVIRAAYHSLARQHHPDLGPSQGQEDASEAADRMIHLNEAYSHLANSERRRIYDTSLGMLREDAAPPTKTIHPDETTKPAERPIRPTSQLSDDRIGDLAQACLSRVREELAETSDPMQWRETDLPGFRWALRGGKLTTHYWVAAHGLITGDPSRMTTALRAAEAVLEARRGSLRSGLFLFLLPVHSEPGSDEMVQLWMRLNRAVRKLGNASTRAWFMIVEVHTSRALLVGSEPIVDVRLAATLERLGLPTAPTRSLRD